MPKKNTCPWEKFFVSFLVLFVLILPTSCSRDRDTFSQEARSKLIQPPKWWEQLPRSIYLKLEKVETDQEWYEVYKLREDTFAVYEPFQFEEAISYLVLGNERAFVIDTGTGIGDLKKLINGLAQLPITVVNTHIHWDQIGNNSQFNSILIYNDLDAITKLYQGYDNSLMRGHILGESIWKPLPEGLDPDTWKIPPTKPTGLLDEGMVIDSGNRPIEVIHTPGHSPDSICLLDKKNRLLFCGDLFYSGPLYAFDKDVSVKDYIVSLEKLLKRKQDFDYLCPAHNEPMVSSDILPSVLDAFKDIMRGKGKYNESDGLRRYFFGDFDIIIRVDLIE